MTWVRFEDIYPENRKVKALSDAAYRLDIEAVCWASRNLTDGRISAEDLPEISRRGTDRNAAELVRRGRWHRAADGPCGSEYCPNPGPDGWVIHDYLEFQPAREKVIREKKLKTQRQARWRDSKRGTFTTSDASTGASRDASRDGPTHASRDDLAKASRDADVDRLTTPAPSRPVPPRPEGGGDGVPVAPPARRGAAEPADEWRAEDQNLDAANARTPVRPPDTSTLRARLAAAARKARHPSPAGAFDELRAATPDVAPLEETWQPPSPGDGDSPGELVPGEADDPQPIDATENPDAA